MKGHDQRGFVFYTNYSSRKGQELQRNSYASLCFWWEPLHRSVCLPCDPQSSAVQYTPSMKCTRLTQTLYRAVCDVLLPSATRSSGRTSACVSVYHNEVGCALLSKLTGRKVQSWHCRYLCGVGCADCVHYRHQTRAEPSSLHIRSCQIRAILEQGPFQCRCC